MWVVRFIHNQSGSFGSFGRTLGVVGLIRVRIVHSGVPWGSLGSFGFVWFIRAHPGCDRVHLRSFGSFGFVWFIRACTGGGWAH